MSKIADQRLQCTSKVPYVSQNEARTRLREMRSGRTNGLATLTNRHKPYRCPWCNLWHIGSTKDYRRGKSA